MSGDQRLLARARRHARTVDLSVDHDDLEWAVSERARRRAGACIWDDDRGVATIRLARRAYEHYDWETFAGVVRHELIHAWEFQQFGESGHGERFHSRAAALEAPRHCPTFAAPRYVLRCRSCEWTAERHRASRPVREPERYGCGECGDDYTVVHGDSGRRWTTAAGYAETRAELGDAW